jgi:carbon monoxide dehydrogenase subunit G
MIFEQEVTLATPVEEVWEFLGNVRLMATCLPGLEDVHEENGSYRGALRITVGPISVRLEGRMRLVSRDRDTWTTVLEIDAEDRRIRSSMRALTTMRLTPDGPDRTHLAVHTDAAVLGKLGQMGQAVLRRKSDQQVAQFVQNMAACLSQR